MSKGLTVVAVSNDVTLNGSFLYSCLGRWFYSDLDSNHNVNGDDEKLKDLGQFLAFNLLRAAIPFLV